MPALRKYDGETQARAVRIYQDRIVEGDIAKRAARDGVGVLLVSRVRLCGRAVS